VVRDRASNRAERPPPLTADARSRRVAVVADSLLVPLLPELQAHGFGAIQLPPDGLDPVIAAEWVEQVAEHVAEFVRNDYEVVLAGDGVHDEALVAALDALGVSSLPQYAIQPPSTSRLTPET
jgi:hypothetical protein